MSSSAKREAVEFLVPGSSSKRDDFDLCVAAGFAGEEDDSSGGDVPKRDIEEMWIDERTLGTMDPEGNDDVDNGFDVEQQRRKPGR